jgi:LssY C-terminus
VRRLTLWARRALLLAISAAVVWVIAFVVFPVTEHHLPWFLAVAATYGIAAYGLLPLAVRLGLKFAQAGHVPAYTLTGDSLPGDPVNLVLDGTLAELRAAFAGAGWVEAERLSPATGWRMVTSFVGNRPYPTAPFSTLYLFGRGQDIGFQKAIDNSPRKRHHIRFWALSRHDAAADRSRRDFWLDRRQPAENAPVYWVGAGTRDTGFGLTRLTFKVTHATDSDTNAERDFILGELDAARMIGAVRRLAVGEHMPAGRVNHYVSDGEFGLAQLRGK